MMTDKIELIANNHKITDIQIGLLMNMFEYQASMSGDINIYVINNLAYLWQRVGEPLNIDFSKGDFGTFSLKVQEIIFPLYDTYIYNEEPSEMNTFEQISLNYNEYTNIKHEIEHNLSFEQKERLSALQRLITGFESFFSLEVLATVDYLTKDDPNKSLAQIMADIAAWSPRKAANMTERYVEIALKRLSAYREQVFV